MVFSTMRFLILGWVEEHYIKPVYHFKYFGFEWVQPLPEFWMYAIHVIMVLASIGVMAGFYYRISAVILFLSFTYTELIDLTYYLNHYYFVSIVCALLIVLPAHQSFSFDVRKNPEIASDLVPRWTILTIQLQLAIVYIYAGLAKINDTWLLEALPLKIWMPANDQIPVIGPLLTLPWMPYVFSWLGMLYDCFIVLFLAWRKTRLLAYASVVFFHLVTGVMFQIGVFPLVMIASTLIFFSQRWHQALLSRLKKLIGYRDIAPDSPAARKPMPTLVMAVLTIHFVFQILFPWRYVLYPGNVFWTEQGYRFSWRVMLMEKSGTATFYVRDSKTHREGVVVNQEFLNAHQEKQMSFQPDMILQFAHFLKTHYQDQGVHDPQVRAEVYVTLNAAPSQLLIDPQIDLTTIHDNWENKTWILPPPK